MTGLLVLFIRFFIGFCFGSWICCLFLLFVGQISKTKYSFLLIIFCPFLLFSDKGRKKLSKLFK